eukprot:UN02144
MLQTITRTSKALPQTTVTPNEPTSFTPNEGSRSRSRSNSSLYNKPNIAMTVMGTEKGESDFPPGQNEQVNIVVSKKQNPSNNIQSNQEMFRIQSGSEFDDDDEIARTHSQASVIYVQQEKEFENMSPKLVCAALIFGVVLMYSIMLTYMVFVDPKRMVCGNICE